MKIIQFCVALFSISLLLVSCESDYTPPHLYESTGGFVRWDTETEKINFVFDLTTDPNPVFEAPITAPSGNVASYDLSFSLVGPDASIGPFFVKSVKSFPSTLSFSAQDLATAAGIPLSQLKGRLDFSAVVTNTAGQSFTADNLNGDLVNPGMRQAFTFSISTVCPSDLAGTFDYVHRNMRAGGQECPGETTGTVTWTEDSEGSYTLSDASFGLFGNCYGDDPAIGPRLSDACDVISLSGSDQYGDSYTYSVVAVDGPTLTLQWNNTYNDGGTVTLTRQDGKNWPRLGS